MKIRELRDGSDEEEEFEKWELVEGLEEAGSSSAAEAVRGEVFPGGGGVGAATGSGGVEVTGRGGGDVTYRGGGEVTGRSGGEEDREGWEVVDVGDGSPGEAVRDEVSLGGGGVGEDTGGDDEATRRGGGELTGQGGGGGWFDYGKRKIIAGGARLLFYPTLIRNVALNTVQAEFRWWDRVDERVLLGSIPFRSHVHQLLDLGVRAVVTLTEPFETLVPTSDYQEHGMEHLEIPTPDYSAAPSMEEICRALHFMHSPLADVVATLNGHASRGNSIYVHCKAGRGRSTTVVLCYLIRFKNMIHEVAWNHIRSKRPRISLTNAQKKAVIQFDNLNRIGGLPLDCDDAEKDVSRGQE